jgi:hypothetical protein
MITGFNGWWSSFGIVTATSAAMVYSLLLVADRPLIGEPAADPDQVVVGHKHETLHRHPATSQIRPRFLHMNIIGCLPSDSFA